MTKQENERLASVEAKMDLILENHLPHIEKRLDSLSKWIIRLLVTTNFLLLSALIAVFFK